MSGKIITILMAIFLAAGLLIGLVTLGHTVNFVVPECDTQEQCFAIEQWFIKVHMNSSPTSCCGKADAYFTDRFEVVDGQTYAFITDDRVVPNRKSRNGERILVPPERLDQHFQGNPNNHGIIFMGNENNSVYCYFPKLDG